VRSPAICLAYLEIVWIENIVWRARIINADTQTANACTIERPCNKEAFVSALLNKVPVNLPDTTPIQSDAAFQLLALAVESAKKRPFDRSFEDHVRAPLNLSNTHFLKPRPSVHNLRPRKARSRHLDVRTTATSHDSSLVEAVHIDFKSPRRRG
jgi:CubicO group peptidase (beta-lactamase class C family)